MIRHLKGLVAAATAAALTATPAVAAPAIAATNHAAPLSVAKSARAGKPTTRGNRIAAGPTATLVSVGILAALTAGVLLATTGGDDDSDSN